MLRIEVRLSIMVTLIILNAANIVILTGFGSADNAQGQVNNISSLLTPQQAP